MKNKKGFTLAEVLITLSILGVVAAISIPNMIQQYQKTLTVTKLKTAYSVLEGAAQNIAINSGCYNQTMKCTGLLDMADIDTAGNAKELFDKFVQLSGLQAEVSTNGRRYIQAPYCYPNCSDGEGGLLLNIIKAKNGINYGLRYGYDSRGILKEGKSLTIFVITDTKKSAKELVLGKNVFRFIMYDNFIVEPEVRVSEWASVSLPMSKVPYEIINKACNMKTRYGSGSSGTGCAAKIVKDGWKITYW